MQIHNLYKYNGLDPLECRICLDSETNEKGELISPCVCAGSQKYIHRSCLNRWREGNREGSAFTNCEICKSKYTIIRDFELENWIIPAPKISPMGIIILYCAYLYTTSFILWEIDYRLDFPFITLPCLEDKHSLLCQILPSKDVMLDIIFYMSSSSIITSAGFFLFMMGKSFCVIQRKCVYWKRMFPQLILHTAASANILIVYILYSLFNNLTIFITFLFTVSVLNINFNINYCKEHNKMIFKMNTIMNKEQVLSLEDNTERTDNIIV
jgi:hypothetical protein